MDRAKLVSLMAGTESEFAYEVVKACKSANMLLKAHGLTWEHVLTLPATLPLTDDEKSNGGHPSAPEWGQPSQPPKGPRFSQEEESLWRERLQRLRDHGPQKFQNFFLSLLNQLQSRGSLSPKQQDSIMKFVTRL